jgi:hypothetical protein
MENNTDQSCLTCYKITCKGCGWEANEEQVLLIQKEKITSCPLCGWQPRQVANK